MINFSGLLRALVALGYFLGGLVTAAFVVVMLYIAGSL